MSKDFPATANVLSRGGKYTGQVDEGVAPGEDLHRKLKARQITMVRTATSCCSAGTSSLIISRRELPDRHRRFAFLALSLSLDVELTLPTPLASQAVSVLDSSSAVVAVSPRAVPLACCSPTSCVACLSRSTTSADDAPPLLQIMGFACFGVMMSLGEMVRRKTSPNRQPPTASDRLTFPFALQATALPSKKGFGGYAARFVDPAMGFAVGWSYLQSALRSLVSASASS